MFYAEKVQVESLWCYQKNIFKLGWVYESKVLREALGLIYVCILVQYFVYYFVLFVTFFSMNNICFLS